MFFIGQEIHRQGQCTPSQHGDQTLLTQGTHQAIKGHGGEVTDRRTPLQAETAMGGQQRLTSHVGSHLAVPQDEMGSTVKTALHRVH
ncbi:MAG TPA: hypothetical protein VIG57_20585 [Candidatus Entotheonella sp.]